VERAFLAGNPLHHYSCIIIDQNAHISPFIRIISLYNFTLPRKSRCRHQQ
jgi:hypothetical protein